MREAYIVEAVRTPACRSIKGHLAETRPEELLKSALDGLMDRSNLEKKAVEDIMIGCAFPEAEQGLNIGRIAALKSGFPVETGGATVNRFCSSGLEAVVLSSLKVMSGINEVVVAGGVESMSTVPMGGNTPRPDPELAKEKPEVYISMGITAENVAVKYGISRADQDEFALESHLKAENARKSGWFSEIVPACATFFRENQSGNHEKITDLVKEDDGIRADTTLDRLSKLPPAFAAPNPSVPEMGTVTAGNSSQVTDGAAALLIASGEAVEKYNLTKLVKYADYVTVGCPPEEMGIGPAIAIPELLKRNNLTIQDIVKEGLIELNEAFASQALYCAREIGIGDRKYWASHSDYCILNNSGGAIALGHPLGCTGSKLSSTLFANMKRLNKKYGIVSMCIGGGMGAAALFELC